jgi:hypothetical protein
VPEGSGAGEVIDKCHSRLDLAGMDEDASEHIDHAFLTTENTGASSASRRYVSLFQKLQVQYAHHRQKIDKTEKEA